MDVRLTLVSASPRRRNLLASLGIPFDVRPSHAAELWIADSPEQLACANAVRKARLSEFALDSAKLLLAADTLIAIDDEILGKPAGPESANRMLTQLSGRWHHVITGYCIFLHGLNGEEQIVAHSIVSEIKMREITKPELSNYIASREWEGKAGAYAIQGEAGKFVENLKGDLENVIGLPVEAIKESLGKHFSHCNFL